jgi:hypothetical protein
MSGHLTPPSSYASIATVTVGSGGASSITFSSIPSTYTHLQLRGISRGGYAESDDTIYATFNGDTAANYSFHNLLGNNSAGANAGTSQSNIQIARIAEASLTSNDFATAVIDILDYTNTNKYKTTRSLSGWDGNGSGDIRLISGNWRSTSAITSITLTPGSGSFLQYTQFALYGIKGA